MLTFERHLVVAMTVAVVVLALSIVVIVFDIPLPFLDYVPENASSG